MELAFINYEDKVALNERPEVAEINKVTANNMNEIKNVVNKHSDNIGNLSNLNTENKDSVVDSINEVKGSLGQFIKLGKNAQQTIEKGKVATINWETELYNNTNGRLTKEGNSIVIGRNVNTIMITAQYQMMNTNSKYLYFSKEGSTERISSIGTTGFCVNMCNIINVTEGDRLFTECYTEAANATIPGSSQTWTYFTITILG